MATIEPSVLDRARGKFAMSSHDSAGAAVRLVNLSKTYGSVHAVRDVNLEIDASEFVTLLGPSGSGKTTTLTMIAGFVNPTEGQIYIDGRSVVHTPPHKRAIGMVFQNYALFPHRTVAQNVAFPLKMRHRPAKEIRTAVGEALDLVRLTGYDDRYPSELSGGQQQRVALARATVFRPRLMLMDEPLGALDRKLRQTLQFELKEIQRRLGATVITVTHDQEEALTMSDRIVVMDDGRIVQVGTPESIYQEPASAFVADFVGETNLFNGVVESTNVRFSTVRIQDNFAMQVTKGVPIGSDATIAIRPEHVRFADDAPSQENTWKAPSSALPTPGRRSDTSSISVELDSSRGSTAPRRSPRSPWASACCSTSTRSRFASCPPPPIPAPNRSPTRP